MIISCATTNYYAKIYPLRTEFDKIKIEVKSLLNDDNLDSYCKKLDEIDNFIVKNFVNKSKYSRNISETTDLIKDVRGFKTFLLQIYDFCKNKNIKIQELKEYTKNQIEANIGKMSTITALEDYIYDIKQSRINDLPNFDVIYYFFDNGYIDEIHKKYIGNLQKLSWQDKVKICSG